MAIVTKFLLPIILNIVQCDKNDKIWIQLSYCTPINNIWQYKIKQTKCKKWLSRPSVIGLILA